MENIEVRETQAGQLVASTKNYGDYFAKTAAATLTKHDSGKVFSNEGAAGSVTITLPAGKVGQWFTFLKVTKNQNLVVAVPATDTINGGAAGGNMTDSTSESTVVALKVYCYKANTWTPLYSAGTWATN